MKPKLIPTLLFCILMTTLVFSAFMAFTSCQRDSEDVKEPEPAENLYEQEGDILVLHRFDKKLIRNSSEVGRVFDTELCVVFYVSANGGVGAPLPLAELRKTTNTTLELSEYCQGSFKE